MGKIGQFTGGMLAAVLAALSIAGCAASPQSLSCEMLGRLARDHARELRWRETDQALQLVDSAGADARKAWAEVLSPIEIVDCGIREISCRPSDDPATSTLAIDYLVNGSVKLRHAEFAVEWRRFPESGWRIVSSPPKLP